ncbi:MAG: PPC domain-containing protein, partial [Acidobacteria bacterium]|nr:PPC domain-containing protein [Acidobacteriota bacterium]
MAAWTASGQLLYADRVFDETGFTGSEPPRPIRLADVEVVDANLAPNNSVIASGATDLDGNYSIFVSDNKMRDVYVRAVTRSDETLDLHIDVRISSSGKAVYYAGATATAQGHVPSTDVNFGAAVVGIGQGGEAFNIYDQMLMGADYLAFLNGARPGASKDLITVWALNNGVTGAFYSLGSRAIILRDSAGYDDTVILHEMGHYAVHQYSISHSPGGFHTFSQCNVDVRLAFNEGFATYWGNSVRRVHGVARSNIYLRSNGAPGPGNIVRLADLETDTLYFCTGAAGEVNVFMFLWDMVDSPTTPDLTPGTDDGIDSISVGDDDVWSMMTGPLLTTTRNSLEDFWDSWFLNPPEVGTLVPMLDISQRLGIEFVEDEWEVNDVYTQASPFVVNAPPIHASFFRDPDMDGAGALDVDSYSFQASAGSEYTLETLNLLSGADTSLRLWDSDGVSLLAVNHDRSASDKSSRIDWTSPRTDQFYIEVS